MWLTDYENRYNTFAKKILKAEVLFHTLKNQSAAFLYCRFICRFMIVFCPVSFPLHAAGHSRWFPIPDPGSARAGVGNSSPQVPGVL